jgi:hypothetical protein
MIQNEWLPCARKHVSTDEVISELSLCSYYKYMKEKTVGIYISYSTFIELAFLLKFICSTHVRFACHMFSSLAISFLCLAFAATIVSFFLVLSLTYFVGYTELYRSFDYCICTGPVPSYVDQQAQQFYKRFVYYSSHCQNIHTDWLTPWP